MTGIVRNPIDARSIEAEIRSARLGAVVTFIGTVRADGADDGRTVAAIEYETYERMASAELESIVREACERCGAGALAIVHRVGEVRVGEASVVVSAAAAHRAEAFAACSYAIEQLKARAPIWKRERYADGRSRWRANDAEASPLV